VVVCKANSLLSDWRGHVAGTATVFIVFAASAADNARMAEHVYKKIEIVGSSPNGMEEAVHNALSRAGKTIRNMRWFEVTETRGYIDDGKIAHWQVTLKIGFTLE
jgi:dodecin